MMTTKQRSNAENTENAEAILVGELCGLRVHTS
jgi:hypothetical protein